MQVVVVPFSSTANSNVRLLMLSPSPQTLLIREYW